MAVTTMSFNIQDYLTDMRDELNKKIDEGFKEIKDRADAIAKDLTEHKAEDTKVQGEIKGALGKLTTFHKSVSRFTWIMISAFAVAFVAFCFDMAKFHLHWI